MTTAKAVYHDASALSVTDHDAVIRKAIRGLLHRMPAYLDSDDAMQIARVGVWRELPHYDPAKGPLVPFIGANAKLRLLDYIRDAEGRRQTTKERRGWGHWVVSLDTIAQDYREPFADFVADQQAEDPEEGAVRRVDAETAMQVLCCLKERELRVVTLRAAGAQFNEIAEALGISDTRAGQIFETARARILGRLAA